MSIRESQSLVITQTNIAQNDNTHLENRITEYHHRAR